MKMDNEDLPRINCTTITTYRNTKTGETSTKKVEGPNIVQDITVQVSPKGLEVLQNVMNNAQRKP